MYFSDLNNSKAVKAFITKKAYIVDGLKAKILIDINIISPELINISVAKKIA